MQIKEMYQYCVDNEESLIAHYILHSLQNERITLDDDISQLPKADIQTVLTMANQNILGFNQNKVYSLKKDSKTFIFIFAESTEQAIKHYTSIYNADPINCVEYPLDYQMARGREYLTFRELRNEHTKFPAIAGQFERR